MFSHHVLFWLKADTTEEQKIAFRKGLESLKDIETVKAIYVGTPAPIDRPIVDSSYNFSLVVIFDDINGHNAYQPHALHQAFLNEFKPFFEKVVAYDAH